MFNGMGSFEMGAALRYMPKLGDGPTARLLPADAWWCEIVFVLDPETLLARKNIALDAADKHGGAHVDASLTPEYERLISSHALGSWHSPDGTTSPIGGHHYVALRQMGYEILHSPALAALANAV